MRIKIRTKLQWLLEQLFGLHSFFDDMLKYVGLRTTLAVREMRYRERYLMDLRHEQDADRAFEEGTDEAYVLIDGLLEPYNLSILPCHINGVRIGPRASYDVSYTYKGNNRE